MSEETLFERALSIPEGERAAFLDRECAGNPTLRARVEALLAADAASHSPLDAAEPLRVKLLGWYRERAPVDPEFPVALADLGWNRLRQQKFAEAEPPLRECVTI